MLSKFSKKEIEEMAKRMRTTAKVPKDSLNQKLKTPTTTTSNPNDIEKTFSGPIFIGKRKALSASTENSHSDGRALSHHEAPSEDQSLP